MLSIPRIPALIICVILFGVAVASLLPNYRRHRSTQETIAALEEKKAEKQAELDRLKLDQQRFKTDRDFIEKLARREHRVYPGELVFIFQDDTAK